LSGVVLFTWTRTPVLLFVAKPGAVALTVYVPIGTSGK
jgi:hypothetical protein